jgi:hypothetical protein
MEKKDITNNNTPRRGAESPGLKSRNFGIGIWGIYENELLIAKFRTREMRCVANQILDAFSIFEWNLISDFWMHFRFFNRISDFGWNFSIIFDFSS